ncbi:MAG: SUMF1/EgtB/PvdO family nonheme iron enzyme [Planctomycetota bacterium]
MGDADGDGSVGALDLTVVLAQWGQLPTGGQSGDLSGDGRVDAADLALVLGQWGVCVEVPAWAVLIEAQPDPAVVTDPELREAIRAEGLAWRVRDIASGIEMLLVPAYSFRMGARPNDALAFTDERPLHHVSITRAYYLGRYETTQAEYAGVMGFNPSYFNQSSLRGDMSRPVESVSFEMIGEFLAESGLRLPTEAEWEFACRAGTDSPTHAAPGQPSTEIAWYEPNSGMQTNPVGMLEGNPLGFHDMLGNVWEWVADWYSGGYYAFSPLEDPQGPSSGIFRVIRGGSWYVPDSNLRSAMRGAYFTTGILSDTGFRVARNP